MTTICHVDHNLIYSGVTASLSDKDPVPRGWVATEPPKNAGVWQWQSTRWGKLDKYPDAPPRRKKSRRRPRPNTKPSSTRLARRPPCWR